MDGDRKDESRETDLIEDVGGTSSQRESSSSQTQTVGVQLEDGIQKEKSKNRALRVEAETQTTRFHGKNKYTQTLVSSQKNQETQTDWTEPKQEDAGQDRPQAASESLAKTRLREETPKHPPETSLQQTQNPDKDGCSSKSKPEETNVLPAKGSDHSGASQTEKQTKPKSYAKAVSSEDVGKKETRAVSDQSQR